jgi:hypothetical protein
VVDNPHVADIAVVSVITSGTVGVLGAAGAVYAQRVTLKVEDRKRQAAWRDDVRHVLDDAAQTAMSFDLPIEDEDKPVRTYGVEIDKTKAVMDRQLGRIGVRVGPESDVYREYARIRQAATGLERAIRTIPPVVTTSWAYLSQEEQIKEVEHLDATKEGDLDRIQESLAALQQAYADINSGTDRFLLAAAALLAEPLAKRARPGDHAA